MSTPPSVSSDDGAAAERGTRALTPAFLAMAQAAKAADDKGLLEEVEASARTFGLQLVAGGHLTAAVAFFNEMAPISPQICRPYALLYNQIASLTKAYRSTTVPRRHGGPQRRILISVSLWGERYIDTFVRYVVPTLLAPDNIPALTKIREIHFDIYTTDKYVDLIRNAPSIRRLSEYAEIQFTLFPQEVLESREYALDSAEGRLRYRIFGGFHHVSVERARTLNADLVCTTPDCLMSNGALTNYVRLVDQGYNAVFTTAIRTQAEGLLPLLDHLRDDQQAISVRPRHLLEMHLQHIHHGYAQHLLTKGNLVPPVCAIFVFPHAHGVYLRCFHIHPMILSADVIRKDIVFDYSTIDSSALGRFFPDPRDFERIKVIEDSDDGLAVEISYAFKYEVGHHNREFRPQTLIEESWRYDALHFWSFQKRLNFHGDVEIDALGTYERLPDGSLKPKRLPVSSRIEINDTDLAAWFEANRPRQTS